MTYIHHSKKCGPGYKNEAKMRDYLWNHKKKREGIVMGGNYSLRKA